MKYRYWMHGTAADGQTWATDGEVDNNREGDMMATVHLAIKASFSALTHGKAVYGKPGVGCSGPYKITRMLIEEVK